jgi:integrase
MVNSMGVSRWSYPDLRSVLDAAARQQPLALVLADAEFDSERNHQHIRQQHGADSSIPAKRGKAYWHFKGVRAQMRAAFPAATCNIYRAFWCLLSLAQRLARHSDISSTQRYAHLSDTELDQTYEKLFNA